MYSLDVKERVGYLKQSWEAYKKLSEYIKTITELPD